MDGKLSNIGNNFVHEPWNDSEVMEGFQNLPYKSLLNFGPLLESMEQTYDFENESIQNSKKQLLKTIRQYPELIEPIEDYSILEKHKEIIQLLMTFIFPIANQQSTLGRAMAPFSFQHIYSTNGLYKLVSNENMQLFLDRSAYTDPSMFVVHAGIRILELHYAMDRKQVQQICYLIHLHGTLK